MTANKDSSKLGDAKGRLLQIGHEGLLRVRLGNVLYYVLFLVAELLACPVLVDTDFANLHMEVIFFRRVLIDFSDEKLPIIRRWNDKSPWTYKRAHVTERYTLKNGDIVTVGNDSVDLTNTRLAQSVEISAQKLKKVDVSSYLQGLVPTEPKHDVMKRYGVQVMNSVHKVRANES